MPEMACREMVGLAVSAWPSGSSSVTTSMTNSCMQIDLWPLVKKSSQWKHLPFLRLRRYLRWCQILHARGWAIDRCCRRCHASTRGGAGQCSWWPIRGTRSCPGWWWWHRLWTVTLGISPRVHDCVIQRRWLLEGDISSELVAEFHHE
jgi:hypothetical protein